MRMTILEVLEEMDSWSPDPNPDNITIYRMAVTAEVDGRNVGDVQLTTGSNKTFAKIVRGAEFDVRDNTRNDKYPEYRILPKPKDGQHSNQRPSQQQSQQRSAAPAGKPSSGGGHSDIGMTVGNALNVSAVFHAHREKSTIEDVLRDALKVFSWSKDAQAGKLAITTRPQPPPARPAREPGDESEREFDENLPPEDL